MKGTYWEKRMKQGRFDFTKDVEFYDYKQINWLIGDIFESIGAKVIGNGTELYDKFRSVERGTNVPDLINWKLNKAYEVKGASWGRTFKVAKQQMLGYRKIMEEDFPLDHPTVDYVLFGYYLDKHCIDFKTEMNLIMGIIKRVKYCVVIPLEIIEKFDEYCKHVYWKGSDYGKDIINVSQYLVMDFQLRFEAVMKELELNHNDFIQETEWSRRYRIAGYGVSKFPITRVKRKDESNAI